jgi:hypothetical protein
MKYLHISKKTETTDAIDAAYPSRTARAALADTLPTWFKAMVGLLL